MQRWILWWALTAMPLGAAVRLYLTDGTYHLVREYQVQGDRVRYYSIERSEWEEIPVDLVDWERTKAEAQGEEERRKKELELLQAEEDAERERARKVARIPMNPGVYWFEGEEVRTLPQAELTTVLDKKRTVLKVLSPLPVVPGKRTIEIEGPHAETRITTPVPEFYIRLAQQERFALIRAKPKDNSRVVQVWQIVPMTNEIFEEHEEVETFRQQLGWNLYLIWPKEPLQPGEYAVIEWAPGEGNIQAWAFGYWPQDTEALKPTTQRGTTEKTPRLKRRN